MKTATALLLAEFFLDANQCRAKFDSNLNPRYTLKDIVEFDVPSLITFAFNWTTTPEGYDYWRDLDRKWYEFYTKYEDSIKSNN